MDFKANVPIYLQVIDDIKSKIITGELPLGTKLPSSRELALNYQINPNTASRIYNEMEQIGLSFTKRGIGTFVTKDKAIIESLKSEQVEEIIQDFTNRISALGYRGEEVIKLLKQHYLMED